MSPSFNFRSREAVGRLPRISAKPTFSPGPRALAPGAPQRRRGGHLRGARALDERHSARGFPEGQGGMMILNSS